MVWLILLFFLIIVTTIDLLQKKHTIRRNFPIIGNFRYLLESIGPELRQYIVTSNNEEKPFNRDERRWVYASSKKENTYFGFGSDNDFEKQSNYIIIKQSAFPKESLKAGDIGFDPSYSIPVGKVLGGFNKRPKAFQPPSVFNISGMSFGALSGNAISAINIGCKKASCLHNTGEGGISKYHLGGGDLIFQIGTAYFACRDKYGRFDKIKFKELIDAYPQIKAIEIKLSQGAKAGRGGLLPASKISPEIALARGIPTGVDCHSPAGHAEFHDVSELIDFVESLSELSGGLPVGIKSAVGQNQFWYDLCDQMKLRACGPDYICIDGGEGGTGAAPLVYSDHVALPFKLAFSKVFDIFDRSGLAEKIVFVGSGKLGFPEEAFLAFALGCDMIHLAREAMLTLGCIQAQRCHSNHCPTGIATQNRWLSHGLDPHLKSQRLANYIINLRKEIQELCYTCGVSHPSEITASMVSLIDDRFEETDLMRIFYDRNRGL